MVDSFLQCELKALSAVRVKPGTGQRSLLRDELVLLLASRSVCPAARPTASRPRTLARSGEVRSPNAKSTVTEAASSDEPNGPFSEAAFVTALRLFTEWDIQARFCLDCSRRLAESRSDAWGGTPKPTCETHVLPGPRPAVSAMPRGLPRGSLLAWPRRAGCIYFLSALNISLFAVTG